MANELNINMDEYTGSCDANEMKRHLREEMIEQLPGQTRYQEFAKQLADLKQKELEAQIDGLQNTESFKNEKIRLMSEVAKIKIDLNKEKTNIDSRIEKNNSLLTKLYSLRESFKNRPLKEGETEQDRAKETLKIEFGAEGKPSLIVQMEGAHGFDFTIHDGKVVFNGEMSDDKLLEVLDFLYRHGIRNFELPSNQRGTSFKEVYARVQQQREADKKTYMPEPPARGEEPFTKIEANQEEAAQAAYAAQASTQQASAQQASGTTATTATTSGTWQNPANVDKTEFEEVTKDFEGWLGEKNQKKKKGLSWFKESSFSGNDVTYSVYNSEDEKNLENDGKRDKNNVKKETCAYRVRLKKSKDGKLDSLEYYVPNDGKIPDALADKMALMIKAQGALYMNFPDGLNPADAGVFRMSCARAGIIPKGISLNEIHAKKMIAEAENNLYGKDLLKYKGQLGRYLLEQTKGNTEDRRYLMAIGLINQEKYAPFKDCFDSTIKSEIEQKGRDKKAEEVIGSARAAHEMYELYKENIDVPFTSLMNSNVIDDQSKQIFMQKLQENNIMPEGNLTLKEMSQTQLKALFNALEVKHTTQATEDLTNALNDLPDKRAKDETVRDMVSDARNALQDIVTDLDANELKGSRTPYLGNPKFDTRTPQTTNTNQNGNQASLTAAARARLAQNS